MYSFLSSSLVGQTENGQRTLSLCVYVFVCVCVCIYIHIYICVIAIANQLLHQPNKLRTCFTFWLIKKNFSKIAVSTESRTSGKSHLKRRANHPRKSNPCPRDVADRGLFLSDDAKTKRYRYTLDWRNKISSLLDAALCWSTGTASAHQMRGSFLGRPWYGGSIKKRPLATVIVCDDGHTFDSPGARTLDVLRIRRAPSATACNICICSDRRRGRRRTSNAFKTAAGATTTQLDSWDRKTRSAQTTASSKRHTKHTTEKSYIYRRVQAIVMSVTDWLIRHSPKPHIVRMCCVSCVCHSHLRGDSRTRGATTLYSVSSRRGFSSVCVCGYSRENSLNGYRYYYL